jgi:pimeloyl-ACP methyl ester carboxylesterase
VAAVTRVCAYDRAGYGFSDPGPLPRDGQAIAHDLERGLAAAGIRGPYVLVAHSAGGLYARLFAARHHRDVKGMVFVDSSVEHQPQRIAQLFGTTAASMDGQRRRPVRCLEIAEGKGAAPTETERQGCVAGAGPGPAGLGLRPAIWRSQLSELDTLFEETSDQVDRTRGLLKDIPAIVLTASSVDGPPGPAADPGAAAWQSLHHDLATRFLRSQHRLVKSGHLMMNERPEVVAAAAIELVEQARKKR